MTNWVEVEIKGLDELQQKLEQLPEKVAAKSLKASLRAGAAMIISAFVAFAPRLKEAVHGIPVGFLAEHFNTKVSMRPADLAGSIYVGPDGKMDYPDRSTGGWRKKAGKGGRVRNVGRIAVASVARYLEFGQRGHKYPFMTPAWESHKEAAMAAIISKLQDALDDAG